VKRKRTYNGFVTEVQQVDGTAGRGGTQFFVTLCRSTISKVRKAVFMATSLL